MTNKPQFKYFPASTETKVINIADVSIGAPKNMPENTLTGGMTKHRVSYTTPESPDIWTDFIDDKGVIAWPLKHAVDIANMLLSDGQITKSIRVKEGFTRDEQ